MKWKTGRPNHKGWYIVRPIADRSDIKVRAYGQGCFWTPLIGGWMSSPEYEYQPGRIMPMAAFDSEEDPHDEWKRAVTRAVELKRLPRTALTLAASQVPLTDSASDDESWGKICDHCGRRYARSLARCPWIGCPSTADQPTEWPKVWRDCVGSAEHE